MISVVVLGLEAPHKVVFCVKIHRETCVVVIEKFVEEPREKSSNSQEYPEFKVTDGEALTISSEELYRRTPQPILEEHDAVVSNEKLERMVRHVWY
ncbi:hypothetical protein SEUCBS139899_000605 [Sporothrix eucalyptigena]